MCGIFAFFNTGLGVKVSKEIIIKAAREAQKRGQDGYGFMVDDKMSKKPGKAIFDTKELISRHSYGLLNCRAKPETECSSSEKNMQPIYHVDSYNEKNYLVHNGAVSESYMKKMFSEYNWEPGTDIDSEGLLCMAYHEGVNEKSLAQVNGGFAFIHMVVRDEKLIRVNIACKYQPLYVLEVSDNVGGVKFFHSLKSGIELLKDYFKGSSYFVKDYEFPPYSYATYEVPIDEEIKGEFKPYFEYPNVHKEENKIKVLCSCSGGIDSTTSLIMAHKLLSETKQNFHIDLVHFMYGHRGQDAEYTAVHNIVQYLNESKGMNIRLKVINLEDIYKYVFNVKNSQLINDKTTVETGTQDKLKSTIAWVPVRNMMFQTIMTGLAETYILEEGFKKVYLIAGWNQLSEEGFYPDNSSRFSNTMMEAAKYGTLAGHKIFTWNICSQILKSEQWLLAKVFDFLDVFKYTISCDIPVNDGGLYYNCNGQCGSTLLSMWASKRYKGIIDPREFKEASNPIDKDKLYKLPDDESIDLNSKAITDVLNRIIKIPEISYNLAKKLTTKITDGTIKD